MRVTILRFSKTGYSTNKDLKLAAEFYDKANPQDADHLFSYGLFFAYLAWPKKINQKQQ